MVFTPLVTVLICCYSGAKFFDETVASVETQDYPGLRVCFHDNGCAPEYQARIQKAAARLKAKVIRSEINRYGEGVRFDVLQHLDTKYLAVIHDDDIFLPSKIIKSVTALYEFDLDFIFSDKSFIDAAGNAIEPALEEVNIAPFTVDQFPYQYIADLFIRGLRFHYSTLVMKMSLAQRVVFGDPYLPRIADGLFVARLFLDKNIKGSVLPERLSKIRVHGNNDMLYSKFDNVRRAKERMLLVNAEIFVFQEILRIADDEQLKEFFKIFPGISVISNEDRITLLLKAALILQLWPISKKMMAAYCVHDAFRIDPMRTMGLMRTFTRSDANTFMTTAYSQFMDEQVEMLGGMLSLGVLNTPKRDLKRLQNIAGKKNKMRLSVNGSRLLGIFNRANAIEECPGFDKGFYTSQNSQINWKRTTPLEHFLTVGWKEGRDPSPYFSIQGYLAENPDVARAGVNPLLHFLEYGWKENRSGW